MPAPERFQALAGLGLRAVVEGAEVLIGADRLFHRQGIDLEAAGAEIGARGQTPLYAAIDGVAVAAIGVSDPLKPSSI